ncbi:hypothetical protein C1645_820553 [Glomus cerebriforme]|uniref:Uncharacterized protein n=1 Tax=Glomus cerebriforme TaxID=658196 RepID=A0A397TCC0_9GLOM|nr:hypothetical protein C1645_820553 [Glomus cerebriforme]
MKMLDDYGAIIIVDYKMRILPATAWETKSEFFEKRGWTLHTTLIFQKDKNNYEKLDIQAHDHWSSDTKQDAWFTASCFEAKNKISQIATNTVLRVRQYAHINSSDASQIQKPIVIKNKLG